MRISKTLAGMKISQNSRGELEISRPPVKMKFKRKCGIIVDWILKNDECLCYRCSQERLE